MSACKLLIAVAILPALACPAAAQAVIWEPGFCAQYYPNANCQNKGPGNPYTGSYQQNLAASAGQPAGVVVQKPRARRTTRTQ